MLVLTMKKKKYSVILSETEREELYKLIAAGTEAARKLTHARVLLKADQSPKGPGWADERNSRRGGSEPTDDIAYS